MSSYDVHLTGSVSVGFIQVDTDGNVAIDPNDLFPNVELDVNFPPVIVPATANPGSGNWSSLASWDTPTLVVKGAVDVIGTGARIGDFPDIQISGQGPALLQGGPTAVPGFTIPFIEFEVLGLTASFGASIPISLM